MIRYTLQYILKCRFFFAFKILFIMCVCTSVCVYTHTHWCTHAHWCSHPTVCRPEDFVNLVLTFHLYLGSGEQAQDVSLAGQAPSSTEPSLCSSHMVSIISKLLIILNISDMQVIVTLYCLGNDGRKKVCIYLRQTQLS